MPKKYFSAVTFSRIFHLFAFCPSVLLLRCSIRLVTSSIWASGSSGEITKRRSASILASNARFILLRQPRHLDIGEMVKHGVIISLFKGSFHGHQRPLSTLLLSRIWRHNVCIHVDCLKPELWLDVPFPRVSPVEKAHYSWQTPPRTSSRFWAGATKRSASFL
jgi:hypothetical protein